LMRHLFKIYDDNMFATSWVTSCLLEAYKYGNAPRPAQEQIQWALEVIGNYHDKNRKFSNSIMTFWPEVYNSQVKTWQSSPQNLHNFFDMTYSINWDEIEKELESMGFEDVAEVMKRLLSFR
jgi:hypothetical protein